jgi:hypothetical protein
MYVKALAQARVFCFGYVTVACGTALRICCL